MTSYFHPHVHPWRVDGTNGEAVVLLHGYTGSPAHWRPLGQALNEEGYTVVCPALAGHGTSLEEMRRTDKEDWLASAYDAVGDAQNHDKIHLAGLSMGGLLALIVAPDVGAASVTTINSPVEVHNWRIHFSRLMSPLVKYTFWDDMEPPDPEVAEYWVAYEGAPLATNDDLMALAPIALKAARRVSVPALVIQSVTDETVKPVSAKHIVRALGGPTSVVWLDDARHVAILDHARHRLLREMLRHFAEA